MSMTNVSKYMSVLLVLLILTTSALAVTEGVKPDKDVSAQTDINDSNQTDVTATVTTTETVEETDVPIQKPTDTIAPEPIETTVPKPTETPDTPGFGSIITIATILSVVYIFGTKRR